MLAVFAATFIIHGSGSQILLIIQVAGHFTIQRHEIAQNMTWPPTFKWISMSFTSFAQIEPGPIKMLFNNITKK